MTQRNKTAHPLAQQELLVTTLIYTGMRRNEVRSLKWEVDCGEMCKDPWGPTRRFFEELEKLRDADPNP